MSDNQPSKRSADRKVVVKSVLLCILTFIVVPVVSMLIATSGAENAVSNSLSRLMWVEHKGALVFLWGFANVFTFWYGFHLLLKVGGYGKKQSVALISVAVLSGALMIIGVCFPSYQETSMVFKYLHSALAGIGFIGFFVACALYTATLFKRNKLHFFLAVCALLFIMASGLFALLEINGHETYVTVSNITQIYFFAALNIMVSVDVFLTRLFPDNRKPKQDYVDSLQECTCL